jgi:pimeloyl-ACP methyl ester carboxylesterase
MIYESNWGPVYYSASGPPDGPVVVCTHGVSMDGRSFAAQEAALAERYRVVVWDLPGHGQSFALTNGFTYDMAAKCLIGILDQMGVDAAVLVGLSLGGHINQYVAHHYPERALALVDIGSTDLHLGFSRRLAPLFKLYLGFSRLLPARLFYYWLAHDRAKQPQTRQYLQESAARMGKKQILEITEGMLQCSMTGIAARPSQPLLLTHGEWDQPFLIKHIANWRQRTPGSQYAVIPQAGHLANQDNPAAFNQALLSFLETVAQ